MKLLTLIIELIDIIIYSFKKTPEDQYEEIEDDNLEERKHTEETGRPKW